VNRLFVCSVAACLLASAGAADAKKPRVLTTFLPAYSFAVNVAGTNATVENLLPGGVSLHDFQLTPAELRRISAADLLLVNGLGMETFLERAIANAAGTKEKVVTLSDGLSSQLIAEEHHHHHGDDHDHAHHHHGSDPHIWLDPRLAMHCVTNVMKALQKADPANAASYAANAASYLKKLEALDAQIAATLAPVKGTPFVTYHNAFRYFARRYGLNIVGVVEQVPEVSPSPRELSALLRTIRTPKAKALFTEPGSRSRLASQIARDAKIKLGELDPLETGTLAADGYETGMKRNAENLRKTLGN
jgi:zinc transport system substrate-binding protein